MSRAAKSLELHRLQGTTSVAAHAPSEADSLEPGRPKFPRGISGEARAAFKRLTRMLEQRRHATPGDQEILRLFSVLYDRHCRALAKIAEEGEVRTYWRLDNHGERCPTEKPNLWLKIAETCESKMLACLATLGLTPASRKAVKPTARKDSAPADPFDELLKRSHPTPVSEGDVLADFDEEQLQ